MRSAFDRTLAGLSRSRCSIIVSLRVRLSLLAPTGATASTMATRIFSAGIGRVYVRVNRGGLGAFARTRTPPAKLDFFLALNRSACSREYPLDHLDCLLSGCDGWFF